MKSNLQTRITRSILATPLMALALLVCWIFLYSRHEWLAGAGIVLLVQILFGLSLVQVNRASQIIRKHTNIMCFFYWLFVACFIAPFAMDGVGDWRSLGESLGVPLLLCLSLWLLLTSRSAQYNTGRLYHSFLLLSITSYVSLELLYMAPLYLLLMLYLRSMSLRSLCAALFGIALPVVTFYFLLHLPYPELLHKEFRIPDIDYLLIYFGALWLITAFYVWGVRPQLTAAVRTWLYALLFLQLYLLAMTALHLSAYTITPMLLCTSLTVGYFFTTASSRISLLLFVGALIAPLVFLCLSVW